MQKKHYIQTGLSYFASGRKMAQFRDYAALGI